MAKITSLVVTFLYMMGKMEANVLGQIKETYIAIDTVIKGTFF